MTTAIRGIWSLLLTSISGNGKTLGQDTYRTMRTTGRDHGGEGDLLIRRVVRKYGIKLWSLPVQNSWRRDFLVGLQVMTSAV